MIKGTCNRTFDSGGMNDWGVWEHPIWIRLSSIRRMRARIYRNILEDL